MNTSSFDIMFATEFEEFYYKDTDEVVPEGEPIGVDVDCEVVETGRANTVRMLDPCQGGLPETTAAVKLILFSNIYWNPQY